MNKVTRTSPFTQNPVASPQTRTGLTKPAHEEFYTGLKNTLCQLGPHLAVNLTARRL